MDVKDIFRSITFSGGRFSNFFFHFQAASLIVKPASFYGNHFRNGGHNDEVHDDDVNIIRTRQRFCRTDVNFCIFCTLYSP